MLYRIEGRLGEGGMGVVYRARAPDGQLVALKRLRSALPSEALRRRFEREARIRIEHPNVARVLDAGVDDDGVPFIALELLEGESLAERFTRGRSSPSEMIAIGAAVCAGLGAAHARNVIHRDVKPSNVFVCADGAVKILDFGVALIDSAPSRLTSPGAVPGTLGYLSPEQARGRVAVDARSDLWSLGAVLYEGLTGSIPFARNTPLATVVATLVEELVPLAALAPEVSPALARVVERSLARDREARYASAAEFATALTETDVSGRNGIRAPMASVPRGERRVIALAYACGVREPAEFEAVMRSHGGVTLPLVGDRALAIFGAERGHGAEAELAARAALAASATAEAVAVAVGWVTAVGATVAGEALDAAERCVRAAPSGVSVDAEVARTLEIGVALTPIGNDVFALGERTSELRDSDAAPLLGRESESAQLGAALRAVLVDRAGLVALIVGPPGVGKSRLRAEVEARLSSAAPHATVVSIVASPLGRDRDLSLVRDLAVAALGADREEPGIGARLIRAGVDPRKVRRHAEALYGLVSPKNVEHSSPSAVDIALVRDRCRIAVVDWFGALATLGPLVIVVDDLHFADDASLEILEDVIDAADDAPLFLLATARPDLTAREPPPFSGRDVVVVEPRNLTHADVAILANTVAGRALEASLVERIADRSEGNPFFVVQLVRAIDGDEPTELPLPRTIEAAVQARLDQLPGPERDLCRRVSVWGRNFTIERARAIGVADPEPLIASLVRRDIVTARGRRANPSFQLKSALVASVAYQSLDDTLRQALHRAAAAHSRHAESDLEERARHHELGQEDALAIEAYEGAAQAALTRGDARSALRCADRMLALGGSASFELRALRVDALRFMGRKDAHGAALEDALAAARTPAQRARASAERALWLSRTGQSDAAVECANVATAAAREAEDREVLILARGRAFLVLRAAGRVSEADAALAEALSLAAFAPASLRAIVLGWRGVDVAARGDLGERLAVFVELAEICEELGDVRRAAGARANLADVYNRLGMYDDAALALDAALADCRRVGHRAMEGYALLNLADARLGAGKTEEALTRLDEAAVLAAATGDVRLSALVHVYRARVCSSQTKWTEAASAAASAASAAAGAMPDLEAAALTIEARAKLRLGDRSGALACSDRAFARYCELDGMEEGEAEVYLARVEVLRAVDRDDEACEVLRQGRERLRAIADSITDPILRERFLRDVPAHRALGA